MGYRTQGDPGQHPRIVRAPIRPLIRTTRTLRVHRRDDGIHMQEVNRQDAGWFRGTTVATTRLHSACIFEPRQPTSTYTDAQSQDACA